jgi:hypothetical protein
MRSSRGADVGAGRRLSPRLLSLLLVAPALGFLAAGHHAAAAPEEIQVYEDDMDKPGQFGLDVHNNYVWGHASPLQWTGEAQPDYT